MEASPLTQQTRPEFLQPKIVGLYETLFREDESVEKPRGFWREFFLLRPDTASLRRIMRDMNSVLSKKYTTPFSDIIVVLAGLDDVDVVFTEFVSVLDAVIRNGRNVGVRQKAVKAAMSITSGAYQTGLVSYLTHRDLFPSLMKLVHDVDTPSQAFEPFVLLGLLANYNKFEFQNPYRLRLEDFVNDATIRKLVHSFGFTCVVARNKYIAVQDDLPEGWKISNTLSYIGLGALSGGKPATPVLNEDEAKDLFTALPGPEAATLLSAYEFANANKLFCYDLVTLPPENKHDASAFGNFLSWTSYLLQHAHRSSRASLYTYLDLFILQILLEDQILAKQICGDENIMVDGLNHNLRRRLDIQLYNLSIGVLARLVSFLSKSRIRLVYHWPELWRSLLSFIRFLATYADDLKSLPEMSALINSLVNLIALSLSTGESFLPDPASYDDLLYKLVESGDVLFKFKDAYELSKHSSSSSIDTLVRVSRHYYALLEGEKGKVKSKNLGLREVSKVIKQGYETLSIQAKEGLDVWEKFREADHRALLKKMARFAVADVKIIVSS
ncbi:hypothetical protein B0A49_09869 [Cryomyces minteri]|uniref:Armadillo-like helical domain-containing protein n=1 Tax=Cryomyces minteri TaxID=331657 RepID=A0A4U0W7Z0_9PEZI|nr:hypothetical protein B0A49_09869 [Cryomyces minteri]